MNDTLVVSERDGRLKTFVISKSFNDMNIFCEELSQTRRISFQLDQGFNCPLCGNLGVDSKHNHLIDEFAIDLSLDTGIDFISETEIHKDHIIHCYMIGFDKKGNVAKYVSLLQMTVSEIIRASKLVTSAKIAVIYSEDFATQSEWLDGILVQSIYVNT